MAEALSQLPSLKCLSLQCLNDLEYISDSGGGSEFSSSSSSRPIAFFPSLKEIFFFDCAAPQNPSTAVASSTIASSSSTPLSKLKSLSLDYIHDLQSLPEEGLRNLTSLQYLSISSCDRLQTLSRGIYHLSALQELYVGELNLRTDKDGMHWKGLKCLVSLKFWYLPELKSLPSGLQHVTTLRKLEISHCSSLMAIPEWIQNWTSLEQFAIERCGSLTRLPEGMRCLISLQSLKIRECPLLFRRCQSDEGEDWPKIAHIPKLDLNWKLVQQTMMMKVGAIERPSTAIAPPTLVASSSTPLSQLKSPEPEAIEDLRSLSEEVLRNLISIKDLPIQACIRLETLSHGVQPLTARHALRLHNCIELDLGNDEDGMQWQGLKTLHYLEFCDLLKLVSPV
ncbi:putative disease resistance protein RGA4 [Morella rubra]|uniref:Putative disease resistance protein RGA4 n=1 Tax=Morella rubra TaxID=262757 RepID=A0A6A1WQP0_9ROSI|nr:putative disease resistance protein RGA4 [Morella rubra]